jgi:hypothetical protein
MILEYLQMSHVNVCGILLCLADQANFQKLVFSLKNVIFILYSKYHN